MSKGQLTPRSSDESVPAVPQDSNMVISWIKELIRQGQLAWRLFFDPRVPWATKLIPPAALIYLLSPIDIIPDLTLGLGQLDDLAVLLLGTKLFIELAPADVVREHLQALGARITELVEGDEGEEEGEEEEVIIEGEFTEEGGNT
jgi:uncharacterized membrane protein YkvA (DUF1232 family)